MDGSFPNLDKETPIRTPKYDNPCYRDAPPPPKKGTPNSGKPPDFDESLIGVERFRADFNEISLGYNSMLTELQESNEFHEILNSGYSLYQPTFRVRTGEVDLNCPVNRYKPDFELRLLSFHLIFN